MLVTIELRGQEMMLLNGGPQYKFTEALSLFVSCDTQSEIDHYWQKLSEGGEAGPCGWLKDKYGVSWQIVPRALAAMASDPNPEKAAAAMGAMLQMKKLDLRTLQDAYDRVGPGQKA